LPSVIPDVFAPFPISNPPDDRASIVPPATSTILPLTSRV
jgi:hypothetical protein